MSTLTFIKYNNYFNRILKGETLTTLDDYDSGTSAVFNNINFDKKDGVDTYQYINMPSVININLEDFDYMLVTDSDDEDAVIKSKWFIIECRWNRKGQYKIDLHRDLLADYYTKYSAQPFYCRRGMPSSTSPLIYNSEGRQYNQILKSRTILQQYKNEEHPEQGVNNNRWIVGFVDKTWAGGTIYMTDYFKIDNLEGYIVKSGNNKFSFITFYFKDSDNKIAGVSASVDSSNNVTFNGPYIVDPNGKPPLFDVNVPAADVPNADLYSFFGATEALAKTKVRSMLSGIASDSEYTDVNGKTYTVLNQVYDGSIVMYRGEVGEVVSVLGAETEVPVAGYSALKQSMAEQLYSITGGDWQATKNTYLEYDTVIRTGPTLQAYSGTLDTSHITKVTIPPDDSTSVSPTHKRPFSTNPYDIFYLEDTDNNRKFAGFFGAQFGGTILYDLQLFPFKPEQFTDNSFPIAIPGGGLFYWAASDSKSGTLSHSEIKTYTGTTALKVGANQDMCRIIAPNGSNAWDFNPALIGGVAANSIKYEFTLIPFASYIHIFPQFGNLYGTVNKSIGDKAGETRGMVCTGPWSFPYSTDNWSTYQLQNAAYKDSFNRDIENMSTVQDVQRTRDKINAILGTAQGGLTGGMGGAEFGPIGAAAGAVVGAASAGVGGIFDYNLNERLRKEQINYTKDQFYNSLRNIQAQARPLASNNSITIGASWFPIVELYQATDDEKTYMAEDLRIHGWEMGIKTTVADVRTSMMSYGSLANSPTRYVQGDLIHIDFGEDFHIANEIAKELNMGVYIGEV